MLQRFIVAATLVCAPIFAIAVPLDQSLRCELSTGDFFKPLIQQGLISPTAVKVSGAINYFSPSKSLSRKNGVRLEAFGMPVESVFGYAAGQLIFTTEDPRIMSPDLYGVVVREQIANVQAQLNALNITKPNIRRLTRDTTEIACIGV